METMHLTRDGLRRLEHELAQLEGGEMVRVAQRLKDIKEGCADPADSVEYVEALEDLARLQARAAELRARIGSGEVAPERRERPGRVHLGSLVTLAVDREQETYRIVGSAEADATAGRVSDESPLGRAVLGHRQGDLVEWRAPAGPMRARLAGIA